MKNVTKLCFVLTLLLFANNIFANTYYSRATGNWNSNTTWSATSGGVALGAGVYPGAADNVIIERGFTVTVNGAFSCATVLVGSTTTTTTAALTFSGGAPALTVSGAVTVGGYGNTANTGTITFISNSTLTAGSLVLGGSGATPAAGIISMASGGTLSAGSLSVNNVAGNTWTPGIGTVQLTATNTLPSLIFTTFNNLKVNGGTTTSSGVALTTTGNVTVAAGTLIFSANNANYTIGGDLIVSSGATFTHNVDWNAYNILLSVAGNVTIDGLYNFPVRSHLQMTGTGKTIRTGNTVGSALSIFTITGGAITASGLLTINDNFWATFNSTGSFSTGGFTVNANAALLNSGGTLNINGGTLNVTGGLYTGYSIGGITNLSSGTLNADVISVGSSTDPTVTGTFNHSGGTANIGSLTINNTNTASAYICSGSPAINVSGSWVNNETFTCATSTVKFNGSSNQAVGGTTSTVFNNVTMANAAGITLGNNITVNSTLNLTTGDITTGSNTVIIPSAGTVTNASASGYINGNVQKYIAGGTTTKTFEIGDAGNYTPVTLAFTGSTNNTGYITANTTGIQHPQIATSGINTARNVNRYWTLTNSGVTFTSYSPTFTFINPGDMDAGAATASFIVKRYAASAWTTPTISTLTTTSSKVTGLTSAQFGDFAIGNATGAATTSTVTSSLNPACLGSAVTFTGTVVNGGAAVAEGSVTFYDGASVIASGVALNTSGQATTTTSSLTAGSHSIKIIYAATTNFATSTSAVITQVINSSPTAVAGTAISTCSGAGAVNITLGSSVANQTSLVWTSSGTGTFANATSITTATYNPSAADIAAGSVTLTLTANATSPCTAATSTKTFTINTSPAVTNQTTSTCSGTAFSVTPTGVPTGTTYTWSAPTGTGFTGGSAQATGQTSISQTLTNSGTTAVTATYTVTPATPTCTGNTFTLTVTVNPKPTVSNQTKTTCSGIAFSVTPTGVPTGTTYTWSAPTGTGFTGGSAQQATGQTSISQLLTNTTTSPVTATYTVTPATLLCTGNTFTVTVTVNPAIVTISPNYCVGGGIVQLTSSAASSYLWSTTETTQSINVDVAGSYSVTATNSYGCSATTNYSVATELVVNGDFSAGNTGFTTLYINNQSASPGLYPEGYYAVGSNANYYHNLFYGVERKHPGTGNFMIVNGSGLTQNIWQESIVVTPNTNYYFSAYAMSLNNGTPFAQLQFSINGTQVGTVATLASGASSTSGPFTWMRFYGSWNSGASTTATLNILDLVTSLGGNDFGLDDISFSTLSPASMSTAPLGNAGSPLCAGNTLNLTANVTGGNYPLTYAWSGVASFASTSQNPSISNASVANSGAYSLTVTDAYGCSASGNTTVKVNALPIMTSASTASICTGSTVSIPLTSDSTSTYSWIAMANTNVTGESTTTQSTSTLSNTLVNTTTSLQSVIYNVTPTSTTGGCTGSPQTVTVAVNPPSVGGTASSSQGICTGTSPASLTVSGITGSVTKWQYSTDNFVTSIVDIASSAGTTLTSAQMGTLTANRYYRAVVQSGPCATANSTVVLISITQTPTTANAGPNQTGAATCGLTTVTLAANTATIGTGAWTIVSGTGGTVTTPSSPTSTFSGVAGNSYVLQWAISNSPCTISTSTVTITFNKNPTTANAGPDQTAATTCGLTTVTLAGNTATSGTGLWTIVSGTGGTITTPSSPTSTFTGVAGTAYTLAWTISNSPCTSSTDNVNITFNQNPTTANAGANQTGAATCGLTSVTLAGNTPTVGTGAWTIVSGTGGIITTPTSPTSTFSGVTGNSYTLQWAISNSPCTISTSTVNITFNASPTTANAGANQTGATTCGLTSVTLAGNTPTVGTGAWTIVSGTGGTITTPTSPTSTFSGVAGNTYTLQWAITNGPCVSTSTVNITFNQNPTTANAGANQTGATTCGLTSVTLAGNTPSVGTGVWTIVSGTGGTITTPTSPTSTFSGVAGNTYTLQWAISNSPCTISTSSVTITFNKTPTTANAGPDQTGAATCGLTTVTLAGNAPTVGTGVWSILSGTGGTITTPSSPTSTFTGVAGTAYTLVWTISNSPCTSSTDNVNITFNQNPTTANAGANQTGAATCGLTSVTLAGNTPTVGTGTWTIVSGTGGTITTPSSPTSTFSGVAGNSYTLQWAISNSPCTISTSTVNITFNANPTVANAGANQTGATTCGLTSVTLAGNTPTVGTGTWTIVSGTGGTITTPSSPTSTFSGVAGNTYTLQWAISNSPCTISTSTVNITFNKNPTVANAGSNQTGATTCGLTSVTLAGNTPAVGTGTWTIVSGTGGTITTPSSPTSTFSGVAGNSYTLQWAISNSPCTISTSTVNITFNASPTVANAGANQTGAATCGLTSVTLAGNTPTVGTGAWTIVSGTGGTITTPTSPTSTFSGVAGNTYTLQWAISNSPCTISTSTVNITFNKNPTVANAGANQTGAATCGLTTVTLTGNTATVGTGAWTIVSGTGGTITTPSSPTSTFSGVAGNSYTLQWAISNSPCTISTSTVNITFNKNPTVANAGANQTGATTCGLTSVTLAGNTPVVGTGTWTIVSGTGGTITTPSSPTSTFSGVAGNTYTLQWAISNSPCTISTSTVNITFNKTPTLTAAAAVATCSGNTTTVNLTGMVAGSTGNTISYTINGVAQTAVSGISADASGNASFTTSTLTTTNNGQTLQVTGITNGSCSQTFTKNTTLVVRASGTWLGVNTNWFDTQNWCGGVPTTATDVLIPSGLSYYPNITTGTSKTHNITIQSGASVIVNGATMQTSGTVANSGVFDATQGTIEMNGSSAQTIAGSYFSTRTILNLIISNTNASGLSLSATANDTLNISGTLSFGSLNNAVFNTNDNLTLLSNASSTARVADITNGGANSGNTINGKAVIQRFMPAHRAWRLMTAPVSATGAQTISAAWQEGAVDLTSGQRNNPNPGFGTHITGGPTRNPSGTGNTGGNGFDAGPNSNSIYSFNGSWAIPANTSSTLITSSPGYMLFVRGDRNTNIALGVYAPTSTTTLRPKGYLKTGTQTFSYTGSAGYHVIGNPFASTINYNSISSLLSNTSSYYYTMDPKMTGTFGVGSFVAFIPTGLGAFLPIPDPSLSSLGNTVTHLLDLNGNIQSGSAFIVYSGPIASSVTIREQDKVSGSNILLFRPADNPVTVPQLRTNLYAVDAAGMNNLTDGVLDLFNSAYSDSVDLMEDVKKLGNPAENIALIRNGMLLTAEKKHPLTVTDTVFYNISNMSQRSYVLEFLSSGLTQNGLTGIIKDSYKGTSTPLNMDGNTVLNFSVDANAASKNAHRFMIVFAPGTTVPVTFTSIKAWQQSSNIAVEWNVANELNIKNYEVEKSTDGSSFTKVATVKATGNNKPAVTYNWLDANATSGVNYYRIRSIDNNGSVKYSQIVKVKIGESNPSIAVYPNPVTDGVIHLQMSNMPKGNYNVRLLNVIGQLMLTKSISNTTGTTTETIEYDKNIAKGTYQLEVINPDNSKTNSQIIIE